jgi:lipopolysaccharide export LptBFGC system permease protein LptF
LKLQVYVLRQLLVATALALAGIGFLVFPGITIQAVHKLEGAGLKPLVVFIPMAAMELVPYLVPLGFLLGVVATFGRLAAENEWTAIRMSGTNPARLLLMPFLVALVLAAGTAWVVHEIAPLWKFAERDFARRAQESATALLRRGRTEIEIGGFYLKAQENPADYVYRKVLVYIPRKQDDGEGEDGDERAGTSYDDLKVAADEVRFRVMPDAIGIDFVNVKVIKGSTDYQQQYLSKVFPLDQILQRPFGKRLDAKYNPTSKLLDLLSSPTSPITPERRTEYHVEIHRRSAYAVTYVLFLLLGFPTGIWLRRGSQLAAFAAAVGFALLYYVLSLRVGNVLGHLGRVPPWIAAWTTNIAGSAAGLWATWRTLRR